MSLSDKRKGSKGNVDYWYDEKDVKDFIRNLKDNFNINAEEFEDTGRFYLEIDDILSIINVLAGKELCVKSEGEE